jgi:membrane-associated phospholipid phosphatase
MPFFEPLLSSWLFDFGALPFLNSVFSFFATYLIFLASLLFVWGIFRVRDAWERIYFLGFFFLQELLSWGIVKETIILFYDRQRPFEVLDMPSFLERATGSAFPSGHMLFMAGLAFIAFEMNRRLGWILLGLTILTGLGRVAVGYHWVSDILGGIIISGLVFLFLKHFLLPVLKKFPGSM